MQKSCKIECFFDTKCVNFLRLNFRTALIVHLLTQHLLWSATQFWS